MFGIRDNFLLIFQISHLGLGGWFAGISAVPFLSETFHLEILGDSQERVEVILSDADLALVHEAQDELEISTVDSPQVDHLLVLISSELRLPADDLSQDLTAGWQN